MLILSTEVYARSLMNQPDLVADILAEDKFFYDKDDSENDKRFHEWIAARDELTEVIWPEIFLEKRSAFMRNILPEETHTRLTGVPVH